MKPRILLYFSLFTLHYSLCNAQIWEPVGSGINSTDSTQPPVHAFCVYNNRLYVGGEFNHAGKLQANSIACWDGKKWSPVGTGLSGKGKSKGIVQSLCVYQGYLYAGGSFDHSGNKPIENIARWKLTDENHDTGR